MSSAPLRALGFFLLWAGCGSDVTVGAVYVEQTELMDQDGDGFAPIDGDCDDELPWVNPSEVDVCDGLDNDCDGLVDQAGVCNVEDLVAQEVLLDVLFLVDETPGMSSLQERIGLGAGDLVTRLFEEEGDFRVGVGSTSPGREGELESPFGYPWIERNLGDASATDWLREGVALGDGAVIGAARAALEATRGHPFHRDGAHLMVVLASLDDDQTPSAPELDQLLSSLDIWKHLDRVSVHGIVPGEACESGPAPDHMALIDHTGGTSMDACDVDADLGAFLGTIAQVGAEEGLMRRFPLSAPAVESTIIVQVLDDDTASLVEEWVYEAAQPAVVLGSPPPRNTRVHIAYRADISPR